MKYALIIAILFLFSSCQTGQTPKELDGNNGGKDEEEIVQDEPSDDSNNNDDDVNIGEENGGNEDNGEEKTEREKPTETEEELKETEEKANEPEDTADENTRVHEIIVPDNVAEEALFEAIVLVQSSLLIRDQPNVDANQLDKLNNGAHIFALDEVGEFTLVYSRGKAGWVSSAYIKEIPYDSTQKQKIDNPDNLLVLVNKQYTLPKHYVPKDLIIPDVPFPFDGQQERKHLRKEAAYALTNMFAASQEDGVELFATSGYRSFATQKSIFPRNVERRGFTRANETSAFPGESEHQTGLAMDVTSREVGFRLTTDFANTDEGQWIKENAYKYGYIIRYQEGREGITGYTYEPWHLRYVGKEPAKEIFERNITLEEYLGES